MSAETPTRIITDHLRYEDGYVDGYQARDAELVEPVDDPVAREGLRCTDERLDAILERAFLVEPLPHFVDGEADGEWPFADLFAGEAA